MTRCYTSRSSIKGFTLVELLVTIMVLTVVMAGLCDVFIANEKAWQRQSGESDALGATSAAMSELGAYAANAMDWQAYSRFSMGDSLAICLPADTSHGIYVPTYAGGGEALEFRPGQTVVFYLSDSTGSYAVNGNILWAGTMSSWGTPTVASVTPDTNWSLYPGTTQPRIAPVSSIRFHVTPGARYAHVDIMVTSSYKAGSGTATMRRSRTICLRNQPY